MWPFLRFEISCWQRPNPRRLTLYDLDSGLESVLWRAPEREEWEVRDLAFSQDGSKATNLRRIDPPRSATPSGW